MDIGLINEVVNKNFEENYYLGEEEGFLDMYHLEDHLDFEELLRTSQDEIIEEINNLEDYIVLGVLNFIDGVVEDETLHLADYDRVTEDMIRTILIYKRYFGFAYANECSIEGIYQSFLDELKEVVSEGLIKVANQIDL